MKERGKGLPSRSLVRKTNMGSTIVPSGVTSVTVMGTGQWEFKKFIRVWRTVGKEKAEGGFPEVQTEPPGGRRGLAREVDSCGSRVGKGLLGELTACLRHKVGKSIETVRVEWGVVRVSRTVR